jgi:hypothetical protein
MPYRLCALWLVVLCFVVHPGNAWSTQTTWDVTKNFSVAHNPNGAWTYSGNGTILNQKSSSCGGLGGLPCWTNGQPAPNACNVNANSTSLSVKYETIVIPPGYIGIDPQSGYCSIEWTAPQTGKFLFKGKFLGIDTKVGTQQTHYVHADLIGYQPPLFTENISSYGQLAQFSFGLSLVKGQVTQFTVQAGSDFHNISTGLSLTITLSVAGVEEQQ